MPSGRAAVSIVHFAGDVRNPPLVGVEKTAPAEGLHRRKRKGVITEVECNKSFLAILYLLIKCVQQRELLLTRGE